MSEIPTRQSREEVVGVRGQRYIPATDIIETDEGITLYLDMPAVRRENVEVQVERNVLSIRGRVTPRQYEGLRLVRQEYGEGDYERTFSLPSGLKLDAIEASVRNGVLCVFLPKPEVAKPRKIAVRIVE